MKTEFSEFIERLSATNVDLSFFSDFEKAKTNVSKVEIHLNALNFLLGKEKLDDAIAELYSENPKCFSVLGILIATRKAQKKKTINSSGDPVLVESYFDDLQGIVQFFEETGLKQVFKNKQIKSLVDFVFGVEVGLDTHARKNRGGTYMERAVAKLLHDHGVTFQEQVKTTAIEGIDWVGGDVKQFDFVIEGTKSTYLVEANFYSSGGSKLSETARSYSNVAKTVSGHAGYEFVWITDGLGWLTAKNPLEDSFGKIERLYNLSTFVDFIGELKSET